jgi:hypothetical protein
MTRLLASIRAMPRALQWGLAAVIGLIVYFAAVEPALEARAGLAGEADRKADALLALAHGTRESDEIALGIRRFGSVAPPGDPRERADAFNRRVNDILDTHKVTDRTGTTRTIPLAQGPLSSALEAGGQRVDRVVRELQFEASPETLAAVVAELERSPEVAAISKVQARKADEESGRVLRTILTVEAWVLARKGAAR